MEMLSKILEILQKVLFGGGLLLLVMSLTSFGVSLKEHNGPGTQHAVLGIAGGAAVVLASLLVNQVITAFG